MKIAFAAAAFALVTAPALAIDLDFTGTISMGVIGTSSGGESGISPFVGVDAEAMISFDIGDDALTVGIILPLEAEIYDDRFLPGHR